LTSQKLKVEFGKIPVEPEPQLGSSLRPLLGLLVHDFTLRNIIAQLSDAQRTMPGNCSD
jgi:hypothetical protein